MNQDLNIVFAGSRDHGKSTLIGRLLYQTRSLPEAVLAKLDEVSAARRAAKLSDRAAGAGDLDPAFACVMDHLAEERAGNITIASAQTFLRAAGRTICIIDSPGHVEFLAEVVTGSAQADAAVVIIAANEGPTEQTRRHLNLLKLLGLRQFILAVSKMDLVAYSRRIFDHIAGELKSLAGVEIEAPIIPISAWLGENLTAPSEKMPWYSGPTFLQAIESLRPPAPAEGGLTVFAVQDEYVVEGRRLAIGRVEAGRLAVGDSLYAPSLTAPVKVLGIEKFQKTLQTAETGDCVGVFLGESATAAAVSPKRGDVLTSRPVLATQSLNATIFWMDQAPLAVGDTLTLNCLTQESPARLVEIVERIDSATMTPRQEANQKAGTPAHPALTYADLGRVRLELDRPLVLAPFTALAPLGRFTLSRSGRILGGGIVA